MAARRKRKREKEEARKAREKLSPTKGVTPGPEKDNPDVRPTSATKACGVSQPFSKLGSSKESKNRPGGRIWPRVVKGNQHPNPPSLKRAGQPPYSIFQEGGVQRSGRTWTL